MSTRLSRAALDCRFSYQYSLRTAPFGHGLPFGHPFRHFQSHTHLLWITSFLDRVGISCSLHPLRVPPLRSRHPINKPIRVSIRQYCASGLAPHIFRLTRCLRATTLLPASFTEVPAGECTLRRSSEGRLPTSKSGERPGHGTLILGPDEGGTGLASGCTGSAESRLCIERGFRVDTVGSHDTSIRRHDP